MKRRLILVFLAFGLLLAIPAAAATANTFVLSNEKNSLVTQMIVLSGWGDYNLYQVLSSAQQNATPSVAGILTPAFLQTLQSCSASSPIFTTLLKNANIGIQALAIGDDCSVRTVSINGSAYSSQSGASTMWVQGVGGASAAFTYPATSGTFLTSFQAVSGTTGATTTYNVIGIAWKSVGNIQVNQDVVVLSNEGTNGLISQLVADGWGNLSIYQVLVNLVNNASPSVSAIISSGFMQNLAASPSSAPAFTTLLSSLNTSGAAVAVSDSGLVQVVTASGWTSELAYEYSASPPSVASLWASTYVGQSGVTTLSSTISGVGRANFTSTTLTTPLTSWQTLYLGVTEIYGTYAIVWAPNAAGTVPALSPWCLAILGILLMGAAVWSQIRTAHDETPNS